MTYDFTKELKKQELENPKDILNICSEGHVTIRKTTDKSSRIQQEYHAMGIIIDDLKKIFKTVPEEDINNRDFCRGYAIAEEVWNNSLHVFFKEKYSVAREDIDIIFAVKDNLPTLEISVEKDGKIVYGN